MDVGFTTILGSVPTPRREIVSLGLLSAVVLIRLAGQFFDFGVSQLHVNLVPDVLHRGSEVVFYFPDEINDGVLRAAPFRQRKLLAPSRYARVRIWQLRP